MVVSRAVNLAAGAVQVALQVASLPAIQAVTGAAVDAFLRTNGCFVGAQSIQFTARDLIVFSSLADARGLTAFSRIDASTMMRRRIVRVLGKCNQRRRKHESKHRGNDWPDTHVVLSFAALARHRALPD
jgi:hypothetical protein